MKTYFITMVLVLVMSAMADKFDYNRFSGSFRAEGRILHTFRSDVLYFLAGMVLILVAGLRYYVGTDYGGYLKGYEMYASAFAERVFTFDEPGYAFLCYVSTLLGGNAFIPIFAAALITVGLCLLTIRKNTEYALMALPLYMFAGGWTGAFNGIRQSLAAAIAFSGIRFLKERRFVPYLLVVLLASAFHRSAIVLIVFYFFVHHRINTVNILFLITGSALALVSFDILLELARTILNHNGGYISEYMTNSVNIFRILAGIAPGAFFLFMYPAEKFDDDNTFWMNLVLLHGFLGIGLSNSAYLSRMGMYTSLPLVVGITELTDGLSLRNRRICKVLIPAVYFFYWIYGVSTSEALHNFQWVWQAGK